MKFICYDKRRAFLRLIHATWNRNGIEFAIEILISSQCTDCPTPAANDENPSKPL